MTTRPNSDDNAEYDALLHMIGKAVTERREGVVYLADYRPTPQPAAADRFDSLLRDYFNKG